MGHCWKKFTIDYALAQIGEVCGKSSKYAKEMDSISYYNYPKDGYANSCKIFVDNSILHGCTDPTAEEDIDCAKWTALAVTYEPQAPRSNAGAGCVQSVAYYKNHGAWINSTEDMACGDEIYYADSDYVSADNPDGVYHTGLIVDWGEYEELNGRGGFKVVEGNTDGGYVAVKYVSFGDPKIYGAGRPDYDGWAPDDIDGNGNDIIDDKDDNVKPTPEPEGEKYKVVNISSWLNVRHGPGTEYDVVDKLYNGEIVTVYEVDGDWGRISTSMDIWTCMDYLEKV